MPGEDDEEAGTGAPFNTPGVADREGQDVFFLKHLFHARQIRNRILECFERASNPTITQEERNRLLSFIVVGGDLTTHFGITDCTVVILIPLHPRQAVQHRANSPLSCTISW